MQYDGIIIFHMNEPSWEEKNFSTDKIFKLF